MSEINMTPLIDVMLVLLVIFIITAPLLASTIKLNLPASEGATSGGPAQFVTLAVNPAGQIYLNDQLLSLTDLSQKLAQVAQVNPETEVQLRADTAVPYGRIVEVMGAAQKAGLSRIGFVADSPARVQPARAASVQP